MAFYVQFETMQLARGHYAPPRLTPTVSRWWRTLRLGDHVGRRPCLMYHVPSTVNLTLSLWSMTRQYALYITHQVCTFTQPDAAEYTALQFTRGSATAEIARVVPHKPKHYILDSLGHVIADSMGLASVNSSQLTAKTAVLCEIMHNGRHWAVQGHSRSPILVPIENPYATSCWPISPFLDRKS